jgi:hypothetical protein
MVDKMLAAEKTGGKVAAPAEEEAQKKKDDALQKQKDNQAAEYIRMVRCPLPLMCGLQLTTYRRHAGG